MSRGFWLDGYWHYSQVTGPIDEADAQQIVDLLIHYWDEDYEL